MTLIEIFLPAAPAVSSDKQNVEVNGGQADWNFCVEKWQNSCDQGKHSGFLTVEKTSPIGLLKKWLMKRSKIGRGPLF